MAIENRFASEEYVLNNRTHYAETITYEWDGNEEGYEIIPCVENPDISYIKISDDIPDINDFSTFGFCECYLLNADNTIKDIANSDMAFLEQSVGNIKKIVFSGKSDLKEGAKEWNHSVCFAAGHDPRDEA